MQIQGLFQTSSHPDSTLVPEALRNAEGLWNQGTLIGIGTRKKKERVDWDDASTSTSTSTSESTTASRFTRTFSRAYAYACVARVNQPGRLTKSRLLWKQLVRNIISVTP